MRNRIRLTIASAALFLGSAAIGFAGQVPYGATQPDIPISSRDRVYHADQTSNTVSVYDPSTNRLLGVILLGDVTPRNLSPLYSASCSSMVWVSRSIPRRWMLFRSGLTR